MRNELSRYFSRVTSSVNWMSSSFTSRLGDPGFVRRLLFGYLAVLIGYLALVQLQIPIIVTDTDMWYHLNGGRYLWTTGHIPDSTFFSYMEPPREWVNYFWGFQAIVFKIYQFLGYQGLVIFRALLFLSAVSVMAIFIFADDRTREQPALFLVLVILLVIVLNARAIAVRPHLTSYLCILLFMHVLQNRPRLTPLLPAIAVIWINLHGVEWIVGALICGAYLIEHLYSHWRPSESWYGLDKRYVVSVMACLPALMVNPYGMMVLTAPFAHDPDIYLTIKELLPVDPALIYSFVFSFKKLDISASLTLIMVIELLGAVMLMVRGRLRISHAIMAVAGIVLLTKGIRFIWEWSLLSLPIVHAVLVEYEFSKKRTPHMSLWRLLAATYLTIMVFVALSTNFYKFPHYPFESEGLPVNTAEFLKRNNAKGNILVPPGYGGYYQWALYPELLIYMDMEFPPFNGFDLYTASWSVKLPNVFERLSEQSRIDFVAVTRTNTNFTDVIKKNERFAMIFAGDSHVLYANRDTQAELVARYEIKYVNPFKAKESEGTEEQQIDELRRMVEITPNSRLANTELTRLLFKNKRYDEALVYARRLVELFPTDPNTYSWLANILENLDRCDEAVPQFKKAMEYTDKKSKAILMRHLGTCAFLEKKFDEAYAWFSKSINPYLVNERSEDMYQYAYTAFIAGESEKAGRLLDQLLWKLDSDDETVRPKAESLRNDIAQADMSDFGVISWLRSLTE